MYEREEYRECTRNVCFKAKEDFAFLVCLCDFDFTTLDVWMYHISTPFRKRYLYSVSLSLGFRGAVKQAFEDFAYYKEMWEGKEQKE